jgi:hypothetical protein
VKEHRDAASSALRELHHVKGCLQAALERAAKAEGQAAVHQEVAAALRAELGGLRDTYAQRPMPCGCHMLARCRHSCSHARRTPPYKVCAWCKCEWRGHRNGVWPWRGRLLSKVQPAVG